MHCHHFVLAQRVEDRVLEVLVRKMETIKKELGSLSKVIDDDIERRLGQGIRHRGAEQLARELERADLDAEKKRISEEDLEAARDRQEDLKSQIERCQSLLEASRTWTGFEAAPFRDALSCSLELLGAERLAEATDAGRPISTALRLLLAPVAAPLSAARSTAHRALRGQPHVPERGQRAVGRAGVAWPLRAVAGIPGRARRIER